MKQIETLDINASFVCLILYPLYLPAYLIPSLLDYNNRYIRKIIPCIKNGEEYRDFRTGNIVKLTENTLEWPVSTGTVFSYKDGFKVLLSRWFRNNKKVLFEIEENEFSTTMIEHNAKL